MPSLRPSHTKFSAFAPGFLAGIAFASLVFVLFRSPINLLAASTLSWIPWVLIPCLFAIVCLAWCKIGVKSNHPSLTKKPIPNSAKAQQPTELDANSPHREQLESLGSLTGTLAHDFNNLLVGVICNAQLLQQPSLSEATKTRCLNGILESGKDAAALAQRMSGFAKHQRSVPRELDLSEFVRLRQSVLKSVLPDAIELSIQVESDDCQVKVEKPALTAACLSLIRLARDAVNDGGRIVVEVNNQAPDSCNPDVAASHVCLSIHAPHLPVETVNSTDDVRPGDDYSSSGVFLAIVQAFARRNQGQFRGYGQGAETSLCLLLPKVESTQTPLVAHNGSSVRMPNSAVA